MSNPPVADDADAWSADDWESARVRRFTSALAATPGERLAWLEEMIALAWQTGALPRERQKEST